MIDQDLDPNGCFMDCPLLFWVIVLIGSRKYSDNPTLIIRLAPKVVDLAKVTLYSSDAVSSTIQAGILLCAWPVTTENLYHDITPLLSASTLQLALSTGLHVFGSGQDFARVKLQDSSDSRARRARLWALCLCTCRRYVTKTCQ